MLTLEILAGAAKGQKFEFSDGQVTLGRDPGNQLALSDYHLSTKHGQIFPEGGGLIYRDLKSTNGSKLQRGEEITQVDASTDWEVSLRDGDKLCLGDASESVVIDVRISAPAEPELDSSFIASRSISDLPKVANRLEHDPDTAPRIYKALRPLSRPTEMGPMLAAIANATFELLPRATNLTLLLRNENDKDRFTLALSQGRNQSSNPEKDGSKEKPGVSARASTAVLKRVLKERAAVLTANAQEEMSASRSIAAGKVLSLLAVPLWRGEEITGIMQVDNRTSPGIFAESDLEMALLLGAQAAFAVDRVSLIHRLTAAEERLLGENAYLKRRSSAITFDKIIGEAAPMKALLAQLAKVVDTRATVCVEGETGTGKELIASAVHYQSRRAEKMFVAQNCAALPENLLESELFGHKKGAFTSADSDKKGLFEIADGGTLFLDEVGEMPLSLQATLLRTLQEGTIRPVGGTKEKQVDVRIICATNRDLQAEVEKKTFREDLYYRLMVFPIRLPPLRERREDIKLLASHFLRRYSKEYNRPIAGLSHEILDAMTAYSWPGNIRELENEIQRLVIQADEGSWIEAPSLSPKIRQAEGTLARVAPKKGTLKDMMAEVERWLLSEALREHGNNKTQTAKTLGITREGLHKKLSKHGM